MVIIRASRNSCGSWLYCRQLLCSSRRVSLSWLLLLFKISDGIPPRPGDYLLAVDLSDLISLVLLINQQRWVLGCLLSISSHAVDSTAPCWFNRRQKCSFHLGLMALISVEVISVCWSRTAHWAGLWSKDGLQRGKQVAMVMVVNHILQFLRFF